MQKRKAKKLVLEDGELSREQDEGDLVSASEESLECLLLGHHLARPATSCRQGRDGREVREGRVERKDGKI